MPKELAEFALIQKALAWQSTRSWNLLLALAVKLWQ